MSDQPNATDLAGTTLPYLDYRAHYARVRTRPALWTWAELRRRAGEAHHNERGSLALSIGGPADGYEIVPGMAVTIQVVAAGERTRPHSHAWWHLFVVQSGSGHAELDGRPSAVPLYEGDVLLVPGWCAHAFVNDAGTADLVLMSTSNLPQQAGLSNLMANEPQEERA